LFLKDHHESTWRNEPVSTPSPKPKTVCVIGPHQLQNELITRRLEEQAGVNCLAAGSLDEARSRFGKAYARITLFLWDCAEKDFASEVKGLKTILGILPQDSVLGLFNVENKNWEKGMILPTPVKGVILEEGSVEDFLRGVSCMLEGKSWLPIDKTVHDQAAGGVCVVDTDPLDELLTPRERSILSLIQQRKSNQQIADALGVTYKTIKNHTNSLFKKMNVSNRFRAALQAKDR
jgi:DNA-binding NarL/FixJ family response regulator